MGGKQPIRQSKVCYRTREPNWLEIFPFVVECLHDTLVLDVWDFDVGSNDFLGEVHAGSLFNIFVEHGVYDLTGNNKSKKIRIERNLVGRRGHTDKDVTGTLKFAIQ